MQNVLSLFHHRPFSQLLVDSERIPLVVLGDFVSPSHFDWINATRDRHCDWVFAWPVSTLMQDYGFRDSFREANPDPVRHPGITWSPVVKYMEGWEFLLPEPQDRIDYVYYKGMGLRCLYSTEYYGNRPLTFQPNVHENEWPSDHAAVISEFEIVGQ